MYCANCGKEIKNNSNFCCYCGAKQSVLSESLANNTSVSRNTDSETSVPSNTVAEMYRVIFSRPSKFTGVGSMIHIRIDNGSETYKLGNADTLELRLSAGTHQIEFSIIMTRKTKIMLEVNRDRHLTCSVSTAATLTNPLLVKPVIVEDENGQKL